MMENFLSFCCHFIASKSTKCMGYRKRFLLLGHNAAKLRSFKTFTHRACEDLAQSQLLATYNQVRNCQKTLLKWLQYKEIDFVCKCIFMQAQWVSDCAIKQQASLLLKEFASCSSKSVIVVSQNTSLYGSQWF